MRETAVRKNSYLNEGCEMVSRNFDIMKAKAVAKRCKNPKKKAKLEEKVREMRIDFINDFLA